MNWILFSTMLLTNGVPKEIITTDTNGNAVRIVQTFVEQRMTYIYMAPLTNFPAATNYTKLKGLK